MKTKFLGKQNKNLKKSGKTLLDSIERIKEDINIGVDIWNIYVFMYLDAKKIPHLLVLEIIIPSKSNLIIESKSMKIYLNHFYLQIHHKLFQYPSKYGFHIDFSLAHLKG